MKITYIASVAVVIIMSGCSYFTFNASMCDQIISDPHSTIPKECRPYNEEDATRAFNNEKNNNLKDEESVEFNK